MRSPKSSKSNTCTEGVAPERDAFNTINAQAGIRTADDRFELTLWGKNLTDKRTNTLVFDSVFQAGSWHTFLNEPRMWGVTAKTNF